MLPPSIKTDRIDVANDVKGTITPLSNQSIHFPALSNHLQSLNCTLSVLCHRHIKEAFKDF